MTPGFKPFTDFSVIIDMRVLLTVFRKLLMALVGRICLNEKHDPCHYWGLNQWVASKWIHKRVGFYGAGIFFCVGGEGVLCHFCPKCSKSFVNAPTNPDDWSRAEIIYPPLHAAGLSSGSIYLVYTHLILIVTSSNYIFCAMSFMYRHRRMC